MLLNMETPPRGENDSAQKSEVDFLYNSDLLMLMIICNSFRVIKDNWSDTIEASYCGENDVRKPYPNFLLVVLSHFDPVLNRHRVVRDFQFTTYMRNVIWGVKEVTDNK